MRQTRKDLSHEGQKVDSRYRGAPDLFGLTPSAVSEEEKLRKRKATQEKSYARGKLRKRKATQEKSYAREKLRKRKATQEKSYAREKLRKRKATQEKSYAREKLRKRKATQEKSYAREKLRKRKATQEKSYAREKLRKKTVTLLITKASDIPRYTSKETDKIFKNGKVKMQRSLRILKGYAFSISKCGSETVQKKNFQKASGGKVQSGGSGVT
ncbi:caldesmon-like [Penaeus japonicus]|uniref:caldesmon-like n=1 Tax=Penaeus japonicus TaxID=27405 RepID=UPI001C70ED74|nr:caldesmon-like [Penaeus japonicus]